MAKVNCQIFVKNIKLDKIIINTIITNYIDYLEFYSKDTVEIRDIDYKNYTFFLYTNIEDLCCVENTVKIKGMEVKYCINIKN